MATNLDSRALSGIGANTDPSQYKTAFDGLKDSLDALQKPLSDINDNVTAISKRLADATNAGDLFQKKIGDIASAFSNWKTISDIFDTLKLSIAGAEAALTGGLSIALAAVTAFAPDIVKLFTSFKQGQDDVDGAAVRVNALLNGLSSAEYKDAVKNVELLTVHFAQAGNNTTLQAKALDDYNGTLGKTIGIAKSFAEADAFLKKNSDKYLTAMADRAAGTEAAQKATEKYIELQKKLAKPDQRIYLINPETLQALSPSLNEHINGNEDDDVNAPLKTAIDTAKKAARDAFTKSENAIQALRAENDPINQIEKRIADLGRKVDAKIVGSTTFQKIQELKKELDQLQHPPKAKPVKPVVKTNTTKKNQAQLEEEAEAEQMRKGSAARQLQITMQGYGDELMQENAHYNLQSNNLKKLLNDKVISQQQYIDISKQLQAEHHAAVGSLIDKYNAEDAEKFKQAANQFEQIRIKGMKDGAAKEAAQLQQQQNEREQQYDKIQKDNETRVGEILSEIGKVKAGQSDADLSKLQTLLNNENALIAKNYQNRLAEADQTANAIKKVWQKETADKAKAANDDLLKSDQGKIDKAKPDGKQAAEKKLISDKYDFEIAQARQAGQATTELESQKNKQLKEIDDKYDKQKADDAKKKAQDLSNLELQAAQKTADAAFSIVKNSISAQANAKVKQLETDKSAELANTSLTSAQRQAIQQDYQKKEAAVKVKAFKDEQLASLGQALINGALAITKVTAQMGMTAPLAIPAIIAETAIQVATIAAQKPPAYAKGGVHYHSDGRGGVLAGYSRTDNTNAYLRSGEGIVVSEAMRVPWARNLVSAINVGFGGRDFSISNPTKGFAVGGIFTDGGDANRYYNQPVNDQKNLSNTIAYQMINNFPPVYVDVKDINNQQNILAQTINRVNL